MRRKLLTALLIGFASGVAGLLLGFSGAVDRLENVTWSWRARKLARPGPETARIRIILLDQKSLDWGKEESGLSWPWPREVYGPLLDFCRRGGARTVAFDVLFTEPSWAGVPDDEALRDAVARGVPFAGAMAVSDARTKAEHWPDNLPWTGVPIDGLSAAMERTGLGAAPYAVFPIPEVAVPAALLGNVADLPDDDGQFRRGTVLRVFDGRPVVSLGLAPYVAAARGDGRPVAAAFEDGAFVLDGRRIPLDARGRAILRFRGPVAVYEPVSAAAVIRSELVLQGDDGEPEVDPAFFKDTYVFFGFSAPGLLDLRPTPVGRASPGVLVHATLLDNFLAGDVMRDSPRGPVAFATLLWAVLCAAGMVFSRRALHSAITLAAGLVVPPAAGFAVYLGGWWWPVVAPWIAAAAAIAAGLLYNYATEGRQKAFIKQAFRHYLGPEVIEQLITDPSRLQLGGERRELTIFFSDIEKFSGFSERMDPQALTALLTEYLSDMGAIIREEGGYLDKYIGDAIVAFWNAPLPQPDHAARALRAALRCQARLRERREALEAKYGAVVKTRIGLNTGEVVVGNMGSRERFNYTILGDAANLASRLEGANKAFGTYLMVSEETWKQTGGAFAGRELARLRVVGRTAPVRVFEPAADGQPAPGGPAFDAGRAAFYDGRFEEAARHFEEAAETDPAARRYAARCRALAADPPADWDGVWNLAEK